MPYWLPNHYLFYLILLYLYILCNYIINKVFKEIINNRFSIKRDIAIYIKDTDNIATLA